LPNETSDKFVAVTIGDLGENDRTKIFDIVAAAPPLYRDLFFRFADKINITCTESSGMFLRPGCNLPDGKTISETSQIRLNLVNDRVNPRGAFYTFFHEAAHMIDWYLGQGKSYFTSYTGDLSQELYDSLEMDVRNKLIEIAREKVACPPSKISDSEADDLVIRVVENIIAGERMTRNNVVTAADELQLATGQEMRARLRGNDAPDRNKDNMVNVSSIFEGITNKALRCGCTDNHKPYYWYKKCGRISGAHQREFFANHYAYAMLGNQVALENERQYFPSAIVILDEMINAMRDIALGMGAENDEK